MKKQGFFILIIIVVVLICYFLYLKFNKKENTIIKTAETDNFIEIEVDGYIEASGKVLVKEGSTIADLLNIYEIKAGADKNRIDYDHLLIAGEKITIEGIENEIKSDLININKASKSELMSLNGIGDYLSDKIIDYREKTPFRSIDEIKNVSGIKDKIFEEIKDRITCW